MNEEELVAIACASDQAPLDMQFTPVMVSAARLHKSMNVTGDDLIIHGKRWYVLVELRNANPNDEEFGTKATARSRVWRDPEDQVRKAVRVELYDGGIDDLEVEKELMLKIEARQWVATVYQCPVCGVRSGETMLTPYQWKHREPRKCYNYRCNNAPLEVAQYKWYTTFAREPGLNGTTIAGTLEKIGPFRVCNIVHPNIQVFKRWYRRRKHEEAAKLKAYLERERQIERAYRARLERQRQEAALLKEAATVVYRREHAAELAAEKVALAAWPVESQMVSQGNEDFDPFLDSEELS